MSLRGGWLGHALDRRGEIPVLAFDHLSQSSCCTSYAERRWRSLPCQALGDHTHLVGTATDAIGPAVPENLERSVSVKTRALGPERADLLDEQVRFSRRRVRHDRLRERSQDPVSDVCSNAGQRQKRNRRVPSGWLEPLNEGARRI